MLRIFDRCFVRGRLAALRQDRTKQYNLKNHTSGGGLPTGLRRDQCSILKGLQIRPPAIGKAEVG